MRFGCEPEGSADVARRHGGGRERQERDDLGEGLPRNGIHLSGFGPNVIRGFGTLFARRCRIVRLVVLRTLR